MSSHVFIKSTGSTSTSWVWPRNSSAFRSPSAWVKHWSKKEPFVRTILKKYCSYLGTRNYVYVLSATEYISFEETQTAQKQQIFTADFPIILNTLGSLLCLEVVTSRDVMFAEGLLTRYYLKSPTYASCKAACLVLNTDNAIMYSGYKNYVSTVHRLGGSAAGIHVGICNSCWANQLSFSPLWRSHLAMEAEYIACFFCTGYCVNSEAALGDGLKRENLKACRPAVAQLGSYLWTLSIISAWNTLALIIIKFATCSRPRLSRFTEFTWMMISLHTWRRLWNTTRFVVIFSANGS